MKRLLKPSTKKKISKFVKSAKRKTKRTLTKYYIRRPRKNPEIENDYFEFEIPDNLGLPKKYDHKAYVRLDGIGKGKILLSGDVVDWYRDLPMKPNGLNKMYIFRTGIEKYLRSLDLTNFYFPY